MLRSKYSKLKVYVMQCEAEHQSKYKQLIKEIEDLKDTVKFKLNPPSTSKTRRVQSNKDH
jgi:hypothetical protein